MQLPNKTINAEFQILGFSIFMSMPIVSFFVLLTIYIFNLLGNLLIIIITRISSHLNKPMYFFICNLSIVDIGFTSVTLPKMLAIIASQKNTISFVGCITQMYFFLAIGVTESFLLALMSYDRYIAICRPLRYFVIMKTDDCTCMVLGCWLCGLLSVLLPVIIISRLPFCNSYTINHFFCDISPVIQLSCSDIHNLEMFIFFTAIVVILGTFSIIVLSYMLILQNILHIPSSTGKSKTFSTCASHLTAVMLYYGTIIFMYIRPKSKSNLDLDKQTSVFYSIITPTLNPMVYSLRNREMKYALIKLFRRQQYFSCNIKF
ncbi:olfactory receptor 6F1-like [Bombina bombina]|uniref:olfactory receptor 6F1-like n=1 Tax=Bombina bombina TaxID=8345 RepID=UPI00235B1164|nr:olfactory receptor 6F1-like [Bombina bombina]